MPSVRWGLIGATAIGREWMIAAIRAAVVWRRSVPIRSDPARGGRRHADLRGREANVEDL
jgi:hypothetical protein